MAGVRSSMPEWRCSSLYQAKNLWQKARLSSMHPNRSGKSGRNRPERRPGGAQCGRRYRGLRGGVQHPGAKQPVERQRPLRSQLFRLGYQLQRGCWQPDRHGRGGDKGDSQPGVRSVSRIWGGPVQPGWGNSRRGPEPHHRRRRGHGPNGKGEPGAGQLDRHGHLRKTGPRGSGLGVQLGGDSHRIIGGATPQEANVIAGNGWVGVYVGSDYNYVAGNYIGTDPGGQSRMGSGTSGVAVLNGEHNIIQGNVITATTKNGLPWPGWGSGINANPGGSNTLRRNSVYGNEGKGIEYNPAPSGIA